MSERVVIKPQEGAQEDFLASSADIAIYGGAAGGGKTFALLLEPLRYIDNPNFGGVTFRRTTKQVKNEGGLWDEAAKIYPLLGATPNQTDLTYYFPSGAACSFQHLEYDKSVYNHQGSQMPLIMFDELTHFSPFQFWYMVSRNRSTCGVKPYIRATCNPDPNSFVAKLIEWWINQETGYPIPERGGKLRWFVRIGDKMEWADSPALLDKYRDKEGKALPAKSLTFIPAKLTDNKILMQADPAYIANLMALPAVERARLLDGNWKIKNTNARVFTNWSVQEFEASGDAIFRFGADWGFSNDPTALVRCYMYNNKIFIDYEAVRIGCEIVDLPHLFSEIPESNKYPINADSSRPETISYLRSNGYPRIFSSTKGKNSIEDGIAFLKAYEIVVHPRCANVVAELTNYSYNIDRATGDVMTTLEDKNNHTIDALRYAFEAVRRAQGSSNDTISAVYVPPIVNNAWRK